MSICLLKPKKQMNTHFLDDFFERKGAKKIAINDLASELHLSEKQTAGFVYNIRETRMEKRNTENQIAGSTDGYDLAFSMEAIFIS